MAFRDQDQRAVFEGGDPNGEGNPIYNVTMAVGSQYAPNKRDDVLLVQFFLKKIYEHRDSPYVLPEAGSMVVDGLCGPTTKAWIRHFQTAGRFNNRKGWVDGRIDRAQGSGIATVQKAIYWISFLNNDFAVLYGLTIYDNLWMIPDMPPELTGSLYGAG